jgi:hypothetical protein
MVSALLRVILRCIELRRRTADRLPLDRLVERVAVSKVSEDDGSSRQDQGKIISPAELVFFVGYVCPLFAIRKTIAIGMLSLGLESKNNFQVSK